MTSPTYNKTIKIVDIKPLSLYLYSMRPGGVEKPHYHDALEIELVLKGSTLTHKWGHFYFRRAGTIHEGINDTNSNLIFLNHMIPAETTYNTHYV